LHLCAAEKIEKYQVDFLVENKEKGKEVKVIRTLNHKKETCSQDFYKQLYE